MTFKEHLYFWHMELKKKLGMVTVQDLHNHWKYPDRWNQPKDYLLPTKRSEYLYHKIKNVVPRHAKILELGCNVGRNLAYLRDKGFSNLTGVEINHDAIALGTQNGNFGYINIVESSIEDYFKPLRPGFDLIFTMAVLEHLHPKTLRLFKDITRSTRYVVTIEDEITESFQHTPRNYKAIFENFGMKQIESECCAPSIGKFPKSVVYRLFEKRENEN